MIKRLHFIALILFSLPGVGQKAEQVVAVTITVSDIDRSIGFFEDVLNFRTQKVWEEQGKSINDLFGIDYSNLKIKRASLSIGSENIELIQFIQPTNGRAIPLDSRSNDLWFQHIAIVVNDMDKAYDILEKHKVEHVSTAPQTLPEYIPAAAGISAFYFRDPDDHNLEVIYFPKGKGDPKWQVEDKSPFIGIDHTAIGISDTDESLSFYNTLLGFTVAGNSENYGSEQEHLNQVFGARLLITGLKATKGFGVEFLDYIAPPGGRLYPKDTKPNDLWYWHTTIKVNNINSLYQKLSAEGFQIISKGIADLSDYQYTGKSGFLVRDPDGHALLLIE